MTKFELAQAFGMSNGSRINKDNFYFEFHGQHWKFNVPDFHWTDFTEKQDEVADEVLKMIGRTCAMLDRNVIKNK